MMCAGEEEGEELGDLSLAEEKSSGEGGRGDKAGRGEREETCDVCTY